MRPRCGRPRPGQEHGRRDRRGEMALERDPLAAEARVVRADRLEGPLVRVHGLVEQAVDEEPGMAGEPSAQRREAHPQARPQQDRGVAERAGGQDDPRRLDLGRDDRRGPRRSGPGRGRTRGAGPRPRTRSAGPALPGRALSRGDLLGIARADDAVVPPIEPAVGRPAREGPSRLPRAKASTKSRALRLNRAAGSW